MTADKEPYTEVFCVDTTSWPTIRVAVASGVTTTSSPKADRLSLSHSPVGLFSGLSPYGEWLVRTVNLLFVRCY